VTRRKTPSIEDNLIVTRESLWSKRLAMETKCLRRRRPERESASDGEGPRVAAARALLSFAGLFPRGLRNANEPLLRELTFSFRTLPEAFKGFRILQLSDFHFNERPGFIDAVCGVVTGVRCDLCVLTGDYRFNRQAPCRSVYAGMHRLLETISPQLGAVAVLGNNDMSDFVSGFRPLGIRVLVNESVAVSQGGESIWIAGVDDPHEFLCDSLPLAIRDVPAGAFTILLAHSPEIISEAEQFGVDLYLCGHTHGGQVCLPYFGQVFLNARCERRQSAGRWQHGDMQGYTTTGIGTSTIPLRFNCPPEAVVIELRREPDVTR